MFMMMRRDGRLEAIIRMVNFKDFFRNTLFISLNFSASKAEIFSPERSIYIISFDDIFQNVLLWRERRKRTSRSTIMIPFLIHHHELKLVHALWTRGSQ